MKLHPLKLILHCTEGLFFVIGNSLGFKDPMTD